MPTDEFAGEQRADTLAFPNLSAGEQELTHLLCTKHWNRTIQQKLRFLLWLKLFALPFTNAEQKGAASSPWRMVCL